MTIKLPKNQNMSRITNWYIFCLKYVILDIKGGDHHE